MASNKKETKAQRAAAEKKKAAVQPERKPMESVLKLWSRMPLRPFAAVCYIVLFLLFVVIAMGQEGFMLTAVRTVVMGLFGRAAFWVAIPILLYLFVIQVSSGESSAMGRSLCCLAFLFLTGCVSHLVLDPQGLENGLSYVGSLFQGGINGTTGGLLCGLLTRFLVRAFGSIFTYVVLIISALLTLLGAMRITIPSLVRAIKNRPRPEYEDLDEPEELPEPASVVVNTVVNKYYEGKEKLHQQRQAQAEAPKPRKKINKAKVKDMLSQISGDIDTRIEPDIPAELPISAPPVEEKVEFVVPALEEIPAEPAKPVAQENKKVTAKEAAESAQQVAEEIARNENVEKVSYCFPPIDLLKRPKRGGGDGAQEMRDNTRRLNDTLASFKIDARIANVTRGPTVTRYEVELERGVRLNKLTNIADDIALSLGAPSVRIAPVPGLISVVGIEVPNSAVTTVSLREVIDSADFSKAKSKTSFCVGKDIGGSCIVGNIAKFPHLLIAGTTGSGKSVCMNSIIISLLYKASPEDVKLIMVDPKMVELGIYNGIPHLLIPVVTDPKKAAGSLQWAVTEMMRRYRTMSDAGVRDLESYNSMIDNDELEGEHLPQVVVIIDELADLMLVAAKEVEESICRIAQMGRAAGIHLIIATQRPSADVITGLMKANIPSRIAFAVASAMESRIILDTQGAEKLVGKGDMLYAPIGCGKPMRVQGCFVTDEEVESVAQYVKEKYLSSYDQSVIEEIDRKAQEAGSKGGHATAADPEPNSAELEGDELLPDAVEVILETKQASVSMLQRRLKLGYARAARIVDEMEEKGIVGPFQGSKPRQILITKEQWEQMKGGQTFVHPVNPDFEEPVPDEIL